MSEEKEGGKEGRREERREERGRNDYYLKYLL